MLDLIVIDSSNSWPKYFCLYFTKMSDQETFTTRNIVQIYNPLKYTSYMGMPETINLSFCTTASQRQKMPLTI